MSNQKNSYDNLIFYDEEEEQQNLSQPKKNSQFLNRLHNKNNKSFEKTWLNTVTEEHRNDLKEKLKQTVGNSKYKFKYLFQIPQIMNNSKLQSRKKTYEIFTKNSQLEQYYLQLKKTSSNSVDTIQSKANYKDILSQISNNKVHDTYQHQNKKNNGVIYTNELWSQKLRNQISEQSRLKELSELLEMNKIKMSYDEQLQNFQEYFVKKTKPKKETISDMQQIISTAFLSENQKESKIQNENQYKKPQTLNIQTYFKPHIDEQTFDYSTKHSRIGSRKHSQGYRPQSQEYSIFSRRASTFKNKLNDEMTTQFNHIDTPNDKLRFIIEDSCKENESTKTTVSKINNFLKSEKEDQESIKKQKIQFQQVKALNNAIKIKKQRETNSHISNQIT
ncbi:unnamed protein product [Paramecium pentaurelia]|uniref:Uncharacterized protein n=1 Tax=Paramecium pentaurelia TaxID=43138 RepID=A0A8S1TDQ9_9CILI|nr:unnamed protein product [Paramecium pentaurelia]